MDIVSRVYAAIPKQKVLTLPEKQQLLHEVDARAMERKETAAMFQISEAAVSGIVKKRSVEDAISQGTSSKKQKLWSCTYGRSEAAVSPSALIEHPAHRTSKSKPRSLL